MSRFDETAGNQRGLNLSAAHFNSQNLNIMGYTVELIEKNLAKGIKLDRKAVEESFIKNVKDVFGENSGKRAELLQQTRCPIFNYYWAKRGNPGRYWKQMQQTNIPHGVLPRSIDDRFKGIMVVIGKNGLRVATPYVGLRSLAQVRYLDVAEKIQESNSAECFNQDIVGDIWEIIVCNVFWFEEEPTKIDKLAEKGAYDAIIFWITANHQRDVASRSQERAVARDLTGPGPKVPSQESGQLSDENADSIIHEKRVGHRARHVRASTFKSHRTTLHKQRRAKTGTKDSISKLRTTVLKELSSTRRTSTFAHSSLVIYGLDLAVTSSVTRNASEKIPMPASLGIEAKQYQTQVSPNPRLNDVSINGREPKRSAVGAPVATISTSPESETYRRCSAADCKAEIQTLKHKLLITKLNNQRLLLRADKKGYSDVGGYPNKSPPHRLDGLTSSGAVLPRQQYQDEGLRELSWSLTSFQRQSQDEGLHELGRSLTSFLPQVE